MIFSTSFYLEILVCQYSKRRERFTKLPVILPVDSIDSVFSLFAVFIDQERYQEVSLVN